MSLPSVISILKGIKEAEGESILEAAYRFVMKRERVNIEREKKKSFTWAQVKGAMKRQRYICPECGHDLPADRHKIHGDHIDPNLEYGLNADANCAALHVGCNLRKSSDSVPVHAKKSGRTYQQIIEGKPR